MSAACILFQPSIPIQTFGHFAKPSSLSALKCRMRATTPATSLPSARSLSFAVSARATSASTSSSSGLMVATAIQSFRPLTCTAAAAASNFRSPLVSGGAPLGPLLPLPLAASVPSIPLPPSAFPPGVCRSSWAASRAGVRASACTSTTGTSSRAACWPCTSLSERKARLPPTNANSKTFLKLRRLRCRLRTSTRLRTRYSAATLKSAPCRTTRAAATLWTGRHSRTLASMASARRSTRRGCSRG